MTPENIKAQPRRAPTLSVLWRVFSFLRPYGLLYAGGIIGIGFDNFFINAFLAKMLMDLTRSIMDASRSSLILTTRLMVAGTLFMVVCVFFSSRLLILSMFRTVRDIRKAVLRKYVDIPLEEVEARHSGDLTARSTISIGQVNNLLMGEVQMLTNCLFSGVGSAVYMMKLDARMGLAGILAGIIPLLTNLPFAGPLRRTGRESQERQAAFTERMSDIIRGQETIRHLNLADFASERASAASEMVRETGLKQVLLDAGRALGDGVSHLSSMGFLAYAMYVGLQNPSLIPATMAVVQLSHPVRNLFASVGGIISRIQSNMGGAERVAEVLDFPSEPRRYERPGASLHRPGLDAGLALEVEGLSFKYGRSANLTLREISFTVPKGRRMALVGPSGGGKSTVIKAILGLYPLRAGDVRAFGNSIYDVPLAQWRGLFSYVPQDAFLFAGTIRDNILGGMEEQGPLSVEDAARLANAHDFISALTGGYRAPVGEMGMNLSGGQKQRIAIARAIYRNAPVLLLDEATASLDTESDALIQEALERLMADRTTLIVAHRLSTVREVDEILYLGGGTILERGSHDELMTLGGEYKRLFEEGLSGLGQSRAP